MAIKHTLVQPGDIIETDNSWCIDHVDRDDYTKVTARQNYLRVEDKSSPNHNNISERGHRYTTYPCEDFVDMNGPEVGDTCGLVIDGETVWMPEIVRKIGLSIRGKTFVVVKMENESRPSHRFNVTAVETEQDGKIKPKGLTLRFNQEAGTYKSFKPSAHTDCIHDVKVIGNKIWDKPPKR